jgi:hypothetical protein
MKLRELIRSEVRDIFVQLGILPELIAPVSSKVKKPQLVVNNDTPVDAGPPTRELQGSDPERD